MELKALALGAIAGVSMTTTMIAPVLALPGSHRATVTPIYCDHCNAFTESGGFSEFVTAPSHGTQLIFGEAQKICSSTYVGARIDAVPGLNQTWQINMNTQGGYPFFVTEYITSTGPHFTTRLSSYSNVNGNIQATFNGPALGYPNFKSIFIYDNGFFGGGKSGEESSSFQDTIDLSTGIQVNHIYPGEIMHQITPDCTGLVSNLNATL